METSWSYLQFCSVTIYSRYKQTDRQTDDRQHLMTVAELFNAIAQLTFGKVIKNHIVGVF